MKPINSPAVQTSGVINSTQKGFSLIEVLITLVLTSVGILGMVALQSRSIQYTQQSVAHNAAISLTTEMIEIMRAYKHDLFNKAPPREPMYMDLKASTTIYNADGTLAITDANCKSQPQDLQDAGECWLKKVQITLPGATDNEVLSKIKICPSPEIKSTGEPDCDTSSNIAVQLAWRSKEKICGPNNDSDICTLITRVEL